MKYELIYLCKHIYMVVEVMYNTMGRYVGCQYCPISFSKGSSSLLSSSGGDL